MNTVGLWNNRDFFPGLQINNVNLCTMRYE